MTAGPLESPRVGTVRPSQMIHTYGPGAMLDLPQMTVMMVGLDDWRMERSRPVAENRLLAAVKSDVGAHIRELRTAPWAEPTRSVFDDWVRIGIPVTAFPRWLRCTACNRLGTVDSGLFTAETNPYRPDRAQWGHANCTFGRGGRTPPLAVAARFVIACTAGHMDEFPWVEYAHHPGPPCSSPLLTISEGSTSGTTPDVYVRCGCGQSMAVAPAFTPLRDRYLPACRGRHPHLRTFAAQGCPAPVRAMLLGASNAWFSIQLSALSIPDSADSVDALVERLWPYLGTVKSPGGLEYAIEHEPALAALEVRDQAELWAAVAARRSGQAAVEPGTLEMLPAEWAVFRDPDAAPSTTDFRLRRGRVPAEHAHRLADLVLADRLREVVAITGMTRVEAPFRDHSGAVVHRAPLSRGNVHWVPVCEVRGEGIFLRLREETVASWEADAADDDRVEGLRLAHQRWRQRRGLDPTREWPGARYVLLHTLAHLLIREIALECGYAAASIRERIYSNPGDLGAMAGILLYTAAPDSDGTLGGLVAVGREETFGSMLSQALDHARLCSSDPLCAHHLPHADEDALHGAACHACSFASETSCEINNRYLDRNLVVETLAGCRVAFFG